MRLALVTNDYPPRPGGIQQYLVNLVAALRETGDEVLVLAPADAAGRPETGVVRHRRTFMWPTPSVSDWVVEHATGFGADAIVFGAPYPLPWMGRRLRSRLGVPVAVIAHGAEVRVPAAIPGLRTWWAQTLRAATARFAVSEYTADLVRRLTGSAVHVLGAGVDVDRFVPDDSRPPFAGDEPVTIGCVSRFVPRKGHATVLAAAAELRERGHAVEVLLAGRGRLEASLRREATRLDVPTTFSVDVPWDGLPDVYRALDVFCMPVRSRWGGLEIEGLGLVYLEAAATGLPVLAGDSGGAAEAVVPGVTGFVVRSTADIVEAVELLLGDRERAREMGRRGRRRVQREFTWDLVARRLRDGLATEGG